VTLTEHQDATLRALAEGRQRPIVATTAYALCRRGLLDGAWSLTERGRAYCAERGWAPRP